MASASGIRAGRAYVELGMRDKLSAGLAAAQAKLKTFGESVKQIGIQTAAAGASASVPFAISAKLFGDFEQRMARVKALTGAVGPAFDALAEKAQDLGRKTMFTAGQAAEAMSFFALAGFRTDQILKAVGPTLDMAAAGQLDMAEAADIAAKIMAGMGLEADDLGRGVDVLTKAMTTANTDLRQLGDAMKYVGPVAKNAGYSLEETVAAVQMLSNAGIQADMAGTTLRASILSLTNPSDEAAATMQRLGVRVIDNQGNVRGLAAIIDDLNRALQGMGSGERLAVIGQLFDSRQAAGFAELLSQGGDRMREFTAALQNSGGTAARVAETQMENLLGKLTKLSSAAQAAGIAVGKTLAPIITKLAGAMTTVANIAEEFAQKFPKLTAGAGIAAAAVAATGAALIAFGVAMKVASVAMIAMKWAPVVAGFTKLKILVTGLRYEISTLLLSVSKLSPALAAMAAKLAPLALAAGKVGLVFAGAAAVTHVIREMAKNTADLKNEMREQLAAGDALRESHQQQANRLNALANKQQLTTEEMQESKTIISALQKEYGGLAFSMNEAAGSIEGVAEGFSGLYEAMRKQELRQLNQSIEEAKRNIQELSKEINNVPNEVLGSGDVIAGLLSRAVGREYQADEAKRIQRVNELVKDQKKQYQDLIDLQNRRAAITGTATSGNTAADINRQIAAAKTTEEWARKVHQLELEQIENEYAREMALLKEKYDYEEQKAREAGESPETIGAIQQARSLEIAALEAKAARETAKEEQRLEQELETLRLSAIDDEYQREIALIDLKYKHELAAAENLSDRQRQLMREAQEAEIELVRRREQQAKLERFREANRADLDRYETIDELQLQNQYKGAELERKMLDLREQRALAAAQDAGESLDLVKQEFALRRRLLDAEVAAQSIKVSGTFSAAAARMLGTGGDEQSRTAKATEETAKYMKRLLEKAKSNALVFG